MESEKLWEFVVRYRSYDKYEPTDGTCIYIVAISVEEAVRKFRAKYSKYPILMINRLHEVSII